MTRLMFRSTGPRQLALTLAVPDIPPPQEDTREALLDALADLLLEALGAESHQSLPTPGGGDESEDHA
jgi:hypothetical protein